MVALVTGGGRGIGRGIAVRLASEGWKVAVVARSADQLAETVALARGKMISVPADVADPAAVRGMIKQVEGSLGPVDLLVNNAGIVGPLTAFWETDPAEWWRIQEVNLRGPMLCCREIVPGMMGRKAGRIINVVSGVGTRVVPGMGGYVESKTALIRFSEQIALELQPYGVSVFPMAPGIVRTAMLEKVSQTSPRVQAMLDSGMDVTPEKVADLVMLLASGKADALSGCLFTVKEDTEEVLRRAEEVRKNDLYVLRVRQL